MAAVEQRIDYKRELYAGDGITIRSSVVEVRDKVIRLAHELIHDDTGEVAARTVIVGVHIDATTRRARSLPSDVRDRATLMAGQAEQRAAFGDGAVTDTSSIERHSLILTE